MSTPPLGPPPAYDVACASVSARPVYGKIKTEKIDWSEFEKKVGVNLAESFVSHSYNDKETPKDIEDLVKAGINVKTMRLEGKPPFKMTWKIAIEFVIDSINQGGIEPGGIVAVDNRWDLPATIFSDIMFAFTNTDTPEGLSLRKKDVPNHGYMRRSACPSHTQFVLGAIIHMLYEADLIKTYGQKGSMYWVELNPVQEEGKG